MTPERRARSPLRPRPAARLPVRPREGACPRPCPRRRSDPEGSRGGSSRGPAPLPSAPGPRRPSPLRHVDDGEQASWRWPRPASIPMTVPAQEARPRPSRSGSAAPPVSSPGPAFAPCRRSPGRSGRRIAARVDPGRGRARRASPALHRAPRRCGPQTADRRTGNRHRRTVRASWRGGSVRSSRCSAADRRRPHPGSAPRHRRGSSPGTGCPPRTARPSPQRGASRSPPPRRDARCGCSEHPATDRRSASSPR